MTMSSSSPNDPWKSLNDPEPHQLVIQLVDPDSRWWFSWAKTSDFPAAIYLEVNMNISFVDKSIQGIVVEARPISSGKSSLLIGMRNRDDLEIFEVFCRRLITVASQFESEGALVRAIRNEILEWHEFLGRARKGLSLHQRMGLFAELVILRTFIERIGPKTGLRYWVGPVHSAQDFINNGASLEIKAVLNEGRIVQISSEYQLSLADTEELSLVVVCLNEVESGESISSICSELEIGHFGENSAEMYEFRRKLAMVGVVDHAVYDSDTWTVSNLEAFDIRSDFPRIAREHLPHELARAKYSLTLAGLEEFVIDSQEAFGRFLGAIDE